MTQALYDSIGVDYSLNRQPDLNIARAICDALGDAQTVVNVGAGAGSYEPVDRTIVAVELSRQMIDQRPANSGKCVQASAMALPFCTNSFDAALAVLTVHHWEDKVRGLVELRRVAGKRTVIFTWNPDAERFWLTNYFPEILKVDQEIFPSIDDYRQIMGEVNVVNVPIPKNCTDGFLCAYWKRPHAYLDPAVRSSISTFSKIARIETGLTDLQNDLETGRWNNLYGDLKELNEIDLGYCLVILEH